MSKLSPALIPASRRKGSYKTVLDYLKRDTRLKKVVAKARALEQLDHIFQWTLLDDSMKGHCRVGQLKGDWLTLIVDSTGWATRVHYLKPELLKSLQVHPEFAAVKKIRCKVQEIEAMPPVQKG